MIVETEVDIDPEDLIPELEDLGYTVLREGNTLADDLNVVDNIKALRRAGCPDSLVERLFEWARETVPTPERLKNWVRSCEVQA